MENVIETVVQFLKDLAMNVIDKVFLFLKEWVFFLLQTLVDFATYIINSVANLIPNMSGIGASQLPDISLEAGRVDQYISSGFLGFARWVLPLDIMAAFITILIAAFTAYHTIGPLLRWAKVIK